MAENDPNYQLLLDEINNLKQENIDLKAKIDTLEKQNSQVIEFNRSLLNKPAAKVVRNDTVVNDKLQRFIEGE